MEREAAVAAGDVMFSSHAYVARMCAEKARLARDQAMIDAQLVGLRSKAVAAYSSFKAIETAADGFRETADRAIANAEQTHIDDFAATAFVQARQTTRRSLAS